MFAAEEPQPRCPLAVVRLDDDGTEQAFTRALRWVPSDDGLACVCGELPPNVWQVDEEWAEVYMIDMVREIRRRRYGECDASVRLDPGEWGRPCSGPCIDLSDGEARLVARECLPEGGPDHMREQRGEQWQRAYGN